MNTEDKKALEANPVEFVEALIADHKNSVKELKATHTEAVKTLKATHTKKVKELKESTKEITHEVAGTYEQEDGKVFKFKTGHTKVRLNGKIEDSEKVLKDSETMEHLIEIGFGGIEEVKK